MFNVATLAPVLQALFSTKADELARQAHFVQRLRRFSGGDFLSALVFGYLKRKDAPLEDLAAPLGVSRQALDQRFTPQAVAFCQAALLQAVNHAFEARRQTFELLDRFNGVFLDDCTQAWLPDDAAADWPGCGGSTPGDAKARMKILARWEIRSGRIHHLGFHAGRASDHTAVRQAPELPEGCLCLRDLGFADFDRMQTEAKRGIYFISRVPAHVLADLGDGEGPLWQQLQSWRSEGLTQADAPACVAGQASGRLVAMACPQEVVARRLRNAAEEAKRRGGQVSKRQKEMCHWTVLLSNVPAEWLSAEQLWQAYRLRWQVELLFKRFKSEGGLGQTRSNKQERVLCEWYVKLLAQVVGNWLRLLHGGPLRELNAVQVGRVISDAARALSRAMRSLPGLTQALDELLRELRQIRPRTRRKTRLTAAQRLQQHGPTAKLT
jgi:Transposase DDE domain